jgi:hypothetical protein
MSGKKSDLFHGVVRRHNMLRRFSRALLEVLDLEPDSEGEANPSGRARAA